MAILTLFIQVTQAPPRSNWRDFTKLIGGACVTCMNNVRIAMLGPGLVADFYMQGLANVDHQDVVANLSRTSRRAREFGRRWSIPESTTNLDALISRDDIDLYLIALPNEVHLPVSLTLSRAGK